MSEEEHCSDGQRHGGMTCREISEFLLAYLERELEGEVHEEFQRHLQACPPCGHYLESYSETVELVRTCGREELEKAKAKATPPPEALIQAILAAKQQLPPASPEVPTISIDFEAQALGYADQCRHKYKGFGKRGSDPEDK